MAAWLGLLGLYQYRPDVLDNLLLPDAIDRDILIDSLLGETAELELLYSDPDTLKAMVGTWSRRRVAIWQQLEETLHYEYNPIHNYDRKETHTDLETRDLAGTSDRSYDSTMHSTTETNTTDTLSKTAYDSGNLKVAEENVQNGDSTGDATKKDTDNTNTTDTGTVKHELDIYARGNIGVTTTQQMIEAQREVVQFSVYEYIVRDFMEKFCVLVY